LHPPHDVDLQPNRPWTTVPSAPPPSAQRRGQDLANVGKDVDDPSPTYHEMPRGAAMGEPPKPRVRRPSNFRQQDVARAIAAAQSRGLDIARVEVDPVTKKIVMVMKDSTVTETNINPFDTAPLPDEPGRRRRKE